MGRGTPPRSQNGIWTYEFQNWWILILDPDSSEDSRVVQPPELSGRTRDVNFPTSRQLVRTVEGGRTSRKKTAMRSRDAFTLRSATVYAAALRNWIQREWRVGEQKPVVTGLIAIAKMAYGLVVWVLILMCMILQHNGHDPDPVHALAFGFQY